jgi:ferrous iron transport protein A
MLQEEKMDLTQVEIGKEYLIKAVNTNDSELNSFLFSLGCYSGEGITVIARRRSGCVLSIKDARYCVDIQLAKAITVEQ